MKVFVSAFRKAGLLNRCKVIAQPGPGGRRQQVPMGEAQTERCQDGAKRPKDQPDQGGRQHDPQPELFPPEWFQSIFHMHPFITGIPTDPSSPRFQMGRGRGIAHGLLILCQDCIRRDDDLVQGRVQFRFAVPHGSQAVANRGRPFIVAFEDRLHVGIGQRVEEDLLVDGGALLQECIALGDRLQHRAGKSHLRQAGLAGGALART